MPPAAPKPAPAPTASVPDAPEAVPGSGSGEPGLSIEPSDEAPAEWRVQFGSYRLEANARSDCERLSTLAPMSVETYSGAADGTWFFCRSAAAASREAALDLARRARALGNEALLIRERR